MSKVSVEDYEEPSQGVLIGLRVTSIFVLLWTFFVLTRISQRLRMLPHSQTLILMAFLFISDVGGIVYSTFRSYNVSLIEARYPLYWIRCIGDYGTRINTALIATSLLIITFCKYNTISKATKYLQIFGVISPIVLASLILAIKRDGIYDHYRVLDSNFSFKEEPIVTLLILILCALITIISLIKAQRENKKMKADANSQISQEDVEDNHVPSKKELRMSKAPKSCYMLAEPTEDRCEWKDGEIICHRKVGIIDTYNHNCQMLRHTLLLVFLLISMMIGKFTDWR